MSRVAGRGRSKGQALTEFALVVPLIVVLFFGIIEFGRFMFAYETLNNAVQEGVRYAIVHGSGSTHPSGPPSDITGYDPPGDRIVERVRETAYSLSDVGVTVCWGLDCRPGEGNSNSRGTPVTVSATYTWRPIVSFVFLPSITIEGTSTDAINH